MDEIQEKLRAGTCPAKTATQPKKDKPADKGKNKGAIILFTAFGLIIMAIVLMFLFAASGPEEDASETYTYNSFTFRNIDGTWFSSGYHGDKLLEISLRHGPKKLEDIPVEGSFSEFRDTNQFYYITFDPREENHDKYVTMAAAELTSSLRFHFEKQFQIVCLVDDEACSSTGTPVVTCETADKATIYLRNHEEQSITIEGGCAVISGTQEQLVESVDRFLYGMYGIMD